MVRCLKYILLMLLTLRIMTTEVESQEICKANVQGKHFLVAFLQNYKHYDDRIQLQIILVSYHDRITEVNVTSSHLLSNNTYFFQTVTVQPMGYERVIIPNEFILNGTERTNKTVEIISNFEISVHTFNLEPFTSDGYLVIPTEYLGTKYVLSSHGPYSSYDGLFVILGFESTVVNIQLNSAVTFEGKAYTSGDVLELNVSSFEAIQLVSSGDPTGSIITSDKPIGILNGHSCYASPGSNCDVLIEQSVPVNSWGTIHFFSATGNQTGMSTYRMVAYYNNTRISVNNTNTTRTLESGEFAELNLNGNGVIISTKPASLMQTITRINNSIVHPSIIQVPAENQFVQMLAFTTPTHSHANDRGFNNFVNIIVRSEERAYLRLNGMGLINTNTSILPYIIHDDKILGSSYDLIVVRLPREEDLYFITQESAEHFPMSAVVYGYEDRESYGYVVGMSLLSNATAVPPYHSSIFGSINGFDTSTFSAEISLTWMNPPSSRYVDRYFLYFDGYLLATTTYNSFNYSNILKVNTNYRYSVIASSCAGNSTMSEPAIINITATDTECDVITGEEKCFSYFTHSEIIWSEARARCQSWGGDLASIESASEDLAVKSIRNESFGPCFIGLRYNISKHAFEWSDGSNTTYRNWNKGEPNNARGDEYCGETDWGTEGNWNDHSCYTKQRCHYCSSKIDTRELSLTPDLSNRLITFDGGNTTADCIDTYNRGLNIYWRNITTLPSDHSVLFLGRTLVIQNQGLPEGNYSFECIGESYLLQKKLQLNITFFSADNSLRAINEIVNNENLTLSEVDQGIELVLTYSNNYNSSDANSSEIYETLVNSSLKLAKDLEGSSNISNFTINNLVVTTSNLLNFSEPFETGSMAIPLLNTKLITIVEILGAIALNGLNSDQNVRILTSQRVKIISQRIPDSIGQESPLIIPTSENFNILESVSFPQTVVEDLSTTGEFSYGIAIIDVLPNQYSIADTFLGSRLLSLVVSGERESEINLTSPIQLKFFTPNPLNHEANCVFLSNQNSIFNTSGLTLISRERNFTVCESTHLTSFGVLIRARDQNVSRKEALALSIVSYILLSCSLIALILSISISIVIGKKFFKVEMNRIYFNYSLALALAITVFIFGTQLPRSNEISCSVFVFLIHYFWIAVFSWGLCISVEIVYLLWITSLDRKALFWYLLPFGWGLPLPIVIITIITTHTHYGTYMHPLTEFCFLAYENGIIWSFIAPILVLLFLNMIGLIMATVKIIQVSNTAGKTAGKSTLGIARQSLINSFVLFPVLGLPWIILPFSLITNSLITTTVFEWFFIILNTPSGVLFLIFFTLRNDLVKQKLFRKDILSPSKSKTTPINGTSATHKVNYICNTASKRSDPPANVTNSDHIQFHGATFVEKISEEFLEKLEMKYATCYINSDIENLESNPELKQSFVVENPLCSDI